MIGEDEGGNTAFLDGRGGGGGFSIRSCVFKGGLCITVAEIMRGGTLCMVPLSPSGKALNSFIMFVCVLVLRLNDL